MNIDFNETQLIALYQNLPQILQKEVVEVSVGAAWVGGNSPRGKKLTLEIFSHGDYWIFLLDKDKGLLFPKPNQKIDEYGYRTVNKIFSCQGYEKSETKTFEVQKPAQVPLNTRKEYELEEKGALNFMPTSVQSKLEIDLTEAQQSNRQLNLRLI